MATEGRGLPRLACIGEEHAPILFPEMIRESKTARNWEIFVAMITIVVGNLTFIYVSANFTSLILRLQTRLEQYRFRLQNVDSYLKRNQVSREVRKRVKRFFRRSLEQESSGSDRLIVDEMPGALRREVLRANIMRRTIRPALQAHAFPFSSSH